MKMIVIMAFLLCVIGARCAAPTARTARTVRTTAVTVLTASVTLSPESACVTRGFMAPSKSRPHTRDENSCLRPRQLYSTHAFILFMSHTCISWELNE